MKKKTTKRKTEGIQLKKNSTYKVFQVNIKVFFVWFSRYTKNLLKIILYC